MIQRDVAGFHQLYSSAKGGVTSKVAFHNVILNEVKNLGVVRVEMNPHPEILRRCDSVAAPQNDISDNLTTTLSEMRATALELRGSL